MTEVTWLGVVGIAFVYQLTVLPGEKVQFIIAGLSTRYHPLLVVSAAGSAFAGWTALEIAFGRALQQTLSARLLDALTAGLFFLFAIQLVRSAPDGGQTLGGVGGQAAETDGGAVAGRDIEVTIPGLDREVPNVLGGFLPIFSMMAVGEFGDKTQLVTIGLAAQYGAYPAAIWAGEMLAIIPVSLLNAYFFNRFAHRVDLRKAHLAGAAIFAFFAADTVLSLTTGFSVWEQVVTGLRGVLAVTV
ncbi:MAG: TMEM165/GDT1 family protein [Halobacteriaceae archaeon]